MTNLMVLTFILDKFLLTDSMHFIKAMYNKKNITSTIQGHNNRRYEKAINNKYSKRQYMIDANLWRNTVLNRYRLKFKIQDILVEVQNTDKKRSKIVRDIRCWPPTGKMAPGNKTVEIFQSARVAYGDCQACRIDDSASQPNSQLFYNRFTAGPRRTGHQVNISRHLSSSPPQLRCLLEWHIVL